MTDSMKFGPEWLRNMSAEPPVIVNNSNNVAAVHAGGGMNSPLALHSFSGSVGVGLGSSVGSTSMSSHSQQHTTGASRNLFPEYRYGREEMLSLFDRNCFLPQILPSFKKLFVDKVQFPLALTPSSEEEINSQSPIGTSSRPAWLQRSAGGFGISSRGSTRGGTVDRGRMRGKSAYHPIYQRPGALYDDNLSATPIKPERNWSERNGIGDSQAVGIPASSSGGAVASGVDWNGTPSSSPRKEFSNHNRNLENWRRNRSEDGSGDGPTTGNLASIEISGWRSGSGTQRWGRSTSWRDEDSMQQGAVPDGSSSNFAGNPTTSVQRSISVISTVSTERVKIPTSGVSGAIGNRQGSSKWTGNSLKSNVDGDDNLPEWAMENPSEIGGTFDSSGAFHGEINETEHHLYSQIKNSNSLKNSRKEQSESENEPDRFSSKDADLSSPKTSANYISNVFVDPKSSLEKDTKATDIPALHPITSNNNNNFNIDRENDKKTITKSVPTPTLNSTDHTVHGDISDRFNEVANEVEKLIMDDDGGVIKDGNVSEPNNAISSASSSSRYVLPNSVVNSGQEQLINQHPEITDVAKPMQDDLSHKTMPFSEQLMTMQHHQHHLHQQHLSAVLPPHMINANPNDLWFYRDPQANVQGPFSAIEMTEWYRAGYFNENLFVRRFSDSRFRPLGELIKLCHGNMPFTHNHLLPTSMDLDNLHITLTPRKPSAVQLPFALSDQQPHRSVSNIDEQLKANVTAAADSLSAAVKGHINAHTMDTTSHMLTMRFQMLQDQYLQHQEYQILSELSKNECFQRLDAAQREGIVRSKVQRLVLPEYLSSFSGLSNSLAALNPIAGSQLYDAIAQQTKKQQQQHIFPGSVDQRPAGNAGIFLDANNFIINAQLIHQQQTQGQCQNQPQPETQVLQIGSEQEANKLSNLPSTDIDLLNEYNLRVLLRGPSTTSSELHQQQLVKSNSGVDFMTETQLLASPMMPIWPQNVQPTHQQQPSQQVPQSWPSMPENTKITLWDVATLEEEQNQNLLVQQQKQRHLAATDNSNTNPTIQLDSHLNETAPQCDNQCNSDEGLEIKKDGQQIQQALDKDLHLSSEILDQRMKNQLNQTALNQSSFKQAIKHQQQPVNKQQHVKLQAELKISEEDRRREMADEKKRLKEERKRQQQEDEKRRAMIAEEENNRQNQEEMERRQQIQAQRRKALLNNQQSTVTASAVATYSTASGGNKLSGVKIDQLTGRSYATPIAPWSLQSPSMNSVAPGLAEIQKAERRERRADQRQQEQLDKQMRANAAAAAEANDALLKWQASPAPATVMSLVDIQAEEAKRLANELVDQQRRREHELHQQQQVNAAGNLSVSGAMANIWGNVNKAWSGSATNSSSVVTSAGLWDDPTPVVPAPSKYMTVANATAASVLAAGAGGPQSTTNKQQSQMQVQVKTSTILPSPRNLRKSQTLPAMQNILPKNARTASVNNNQSQQQPDKTKVVNNKISVKSAASASGDDKKSAVRILQHSDASSQSKISEYENEFTIWCMKSLDNMSAKVDVPTFVAFLQDLEAPYEVKDYVRIYLGEGKDSSDFVKQFLERRSKYKSMQRAQNAHNDDMCKPAPAITPSSNDNGEHKNKQKKIKKNKMTKMDARILGFSVTAAEGRINVGSRDYVDGP